MSHGKLLLITSWISGASVNRTPPKELVDLAKQLTLHGANLSIVSDTDDYPWFIREFQKQLMA